MPASGKSRESIVKRGAPSATAPSRGSVAIPTRGSAAISPPQRSARTAPRLIATKKLIFQLIDRNAPLAALYSASQMDRIKMVKEGVPSSFVGLLVHDLNMPKERFYGMIGVSRATVDRKVKERKLLNRSEGESVLAMGRLIGQVEEMVRTSGDPTGFDAARWVSAWLQEPLPALGGQRPADYMDTEEGRALVSGLIAQIQSGAYA